jgi:hypothetical protein
MCGGGGVEARDGRRHQKNNSFSRMNEHAARCGFVETPWQSNDGNPLAVGGFFEL